MKLCRDTGIKVSRVAISLIVLSSLAQADEVVVQASTARSRITITGDILEYNGRG